ncbi:hypothetical protein [Methylomonas koyamae]|uniref:hypothetical protein n=1 Tax=Methylomonas koyamae TaxID=702114 RepID=UPI00210F2F00|nr:hypothetical protein [Methylomonas koyamae]
MGFQGLHRNDTAVRRQRQAVSAVGLIQKGRDRIVRRNPDNFIGVGFGKQQTAVAVSERPFRAVESVLDFIDQHPAGRHPKNRRRINIVGSRSRRTQQRTDTERQQTLG